MPAVFLAGCATFESHESGAPDPTEQLQERVDKVEERLSGIQMEQARLQRDLDKLQQQVAQSASGAVTPAQLAELEHRLQTVDAAREADKKALYDQLSRRIAEILSGRATAAASSGSDSARAGGGSRNEHVVQPGETLSQIAAQHKKSVSAILKANGLKDANSIHAGQKLVIP